jgi:multiple sugar transport system permease protein
VKTSRAAVFFRAIVIVGVLLWSLSPVALGILTSFSTQTDVNAVPARWVPHHLTLDAYRALIGGNSGKAGGTATESGTFGQAMLNSTELALLSTVAVLIVSTMASYAFSRLPFRGRRPVFYATLSTMIVPIFVVVVALFQVLARFHLIDTKTGLVLVFVATLSPLATWILQNSIRELPHEPEEAALIDGCTRWQAFVRVVLPQMGASLAALSAILVLWVWGEFLIPLLLTSTLNAKPVTVLITEYVGKYSTNYPILAAAGVLALLPPAALVLALNRRITGMLAGSS